MEAPLLRWEYKGKHADLDAAYGWDADIADEDARRELVARNAAGGSE